MRAYKPTTTGAVTGRPKYYGEFDSQKECAENYVEETIDLDNVPDLIRFNIDYEELYHDLDFTEIEADRTTYFFTNH